MVAGLSPFCATCHQSTIIGTGKRNGWVAIVSYLFALGGGLIALSHGEMDERGLPACLLLVNRAGLCKYRKQQGIHLLIILEIC